MSFNTSDSLSNSLLSFIVPLKSKQVSYSWSRTCSLLERTLRSICAQTSPNFTVLVVCHEKPEISFSHPNIVFVEANFSPPPSNCSRRDKNVDKGRKILLAYEKIKQLNSSYLMVVDADDCINKNILKYIENHRDMPGWFINTGYLYTEGSNKLYLRSKMFHLFCGSGLIMQPHYLDNFIDFSSRNIYTHSATDILVRLGLKAFPFIGVIYVQMNGENNFWTQEHAEAFHSKKTKENSLVRKVWDLTKYRWLNKKISQEFGLYKVRTPHEFQSNKSQ